MDLIKKAVVAFVFILLFSSFQPVQTLKGNWEYAGDIFNSKAEGAPKEYALLRRYDNTGYKAFIIEKGYKDEVYEKGDYTLKNDTCFETQTWCGQPSDVLHKTITYTYTVNNDTLTFSGVLPNGQAVKEYWKKVK